MIMIIIIINDNDNNTYLKTTMMIYDMIDNDVM